MRADGPIVGSNDGTALYGRTRGIRTDCFTDGIRPSSSAIQYIDTKRAVCPAVRRAPLPFKTRRNGVWLPGACWLFVSCFSCCCCVLQFKVSVLSCYYVPKQALGMRCSAQNVTAHRHISPSMSFAGGLSHRSSALAPLFPSLHALLVRSHRTPLLFCSLSQLVSTNLQWPLQADATYKRFGWVLTAQVRV